MIYHLKNFGQEAKGIRQSIQLTQSKVRELIGLHEDTIRRLEKGETMPTIETLDLLSIAYKCDMTEVFSRHKMTFDMYFEDRIKKVLPIIRNLDYKELENEAREFEKEFKQLEKVNSQVINHKYLQYFEYLKVISRFEKAVEDKSRIDITRLVQVSGYNISQIRKKESLILDKLEIRIFILCSIIYRYKDEFDTSILYLKTALDALNERYAKDPSYLYYYFLITLNLMTYYHRLDDYMALRKTYESSLDVLEDIIGLPTMASVFLRIGINEHLMENSKGSAFVEVGLKLLKDSQYHTKADKFHKRLKEDYPDLIKTMD